MIERVVADKATSTQSSDVRKRSSISWSRRTILGKRYDATTAQIACVVHDRFEAEDALAFGVCLECQVAEMYLEHGQVILRNLERDRRRARFGGSTIGTSSRQANCSTKRWWSSETCRK
jgi:hypothetical protein